MTTRRVEMPTKHMCILVSKHKRLSKASERVGNASPILVKVR